MKSLHSRTRSSTIVVSTCRPSLVHTGLGRGTDVVQHCASGNVWHARSGHKHHGELFPNAGLHKAPKDSFFLNDQCVRT